MSSTGHRIRAAAVAARAELLKLASAKLGVATSSLTVSKGVVSGGGKSATYGELVGGKLFNVTLKTTSLQHGVSPAKPLGQYRLVGTMAPRVDLPAKIRGNNVYTHNITVPGMLHGRWVRPGQGPWLTPGFAKPLSVDASSLAHLPNVKVLRQGDFVGVVGPVEYQVVQAAAQLKVTWAESPILPGSGNLFKSLRNADSAGKMPARVTSSVGNFDAAYKSAAKTVSASFMAAYNAHAPIGPACAVADYKALGGPDKDMVTVFSNTQNNASTVAGIQDTLQLKRPNQARVIFYEGSSSSATATTTSTSTSRPHSCRSSRAPGPAPADALGRAGLEQVRAGDHARPARRCRRQGQHVAYEAVAFAQTGAGDAAVRQLLGDVPRPAQRTRTPKTSHRCTRSRATRSAGRATG